jgi:hypothetical protein
MRHGRNHCSPPRVIDGALLYIGRAELVARMADDLIEAGTFNDEREAVRSLFGKYPYFQISLLIDDARQAAVQEIVAREMSTP